MTYKVITLLIFAMYQLRNTQALRQREIQTYCMSGFSAGREIKVINP